MAAKQSKIWAYIIIAILVLFLASVGVGAYFYITQKKKITDREYKINVLDHYIDSLLQYPVVCTTYIEKVVEKPVIRYIKGKDIEHTVVKYVTEKCDSTNLSIREYDIVNKTEHFSQMLKVSTYGWLNNVEFGTYTFREKVIENTSVLPGKPIFIGQPPDRSHLYATLHTRHNYTDWFSGVGLGLQYVRKDKWLVGLSIGRDMLQQDMFLQLQGGIKLW